MNRPRIASLLGIAFSSLLLAILLGACSSTSNLPRSAKRVVFLGDSITYGGDYVAFTQAWFYVHEPARTVDIIDVGLGSETVSGLSEEGHAGGKFPRPDLHERLTRVLDATKPDLVFACYGMNDGIYLPLDEQRFAKFRAGMERLHNEVVGRGAKIIHLTPPTYDPLRGKAKGYNEVLDAYSAWLLSQREKGWSVIDLHGPMNAYLAKRRATEPEFYLAKDAIHPSELGHWLMARSLLAGLGVTRIAHFESAQEALGNIPKAAEIISKSREQVRLLRDAWLTETKHKRPGLPAGLTLPEATEKAATLTQQIRALVSD